MTFSTCSGMRSISWHQKTLFTPRKTMIPLFSQQCSCSQALPQAVHFKARRQATALNPSSQTTPPTPPSSKIQTAGMSSPPTTEERTFPQRVHQLQLDPVPFCQTTLCPTQGHGRVVKIPGFLMSARLATYTFFTTPQQTHNRRRSIV